MTSTSTYTYGIDYNPVMGVVTRARGRKKGVQGFLSVDPLASERSWVSPYNFVQNSPISRIDPNGALDESVDSPDWIPTLNKDNTITYTSEQGDSYDTFVEQYGAEAAAEIFSDNPVRGELMSGELAAGELELTGSIYPLQIRREFIERNPVSTILGGVFGQSDLKTLTPLQHIYNQVLLAEDYANQNEGVFQINDFLTNAGYKSLGSISERGALTDRNGNRYNDVIIEYDPGYSQGGQLYPSGHNPRRINEFDIRRYISSANVSVLSVSTNLKSKSKAKPGT